MTSSLQPHDLRGRIPAATPTPTQLAIRAGLDVAEQLATAQQSLRRIDTVLRLMRDTYVQSGDTRAVSLIDTILAQVVGPDLAICEAVNAPMPPEPAPAGAEVYAIGVRHPEDPNPVEVTDAF